MLPTLRKTGGGAMVVVVVVGGRSQPVRPADILLVACSDSSSREEEEGLEAATGNQGWRQGPFSRRGCPESTTTRAKARVGQRVV